MISLVFASAAVAQGAHWEAITSANEVATICAVRQGVRLDDKKTSPDIIARAAVAACNQELIRLDDPVASNAAIEMPTVPQSQREPMVGDQTRSMRKRIEDLTIQAILERRVTNAPRQ